MKAGEIVIYLNGQGIDKYTIYTSDEIPVDILNSLEYLRGRIEDLTGHRLTISSERGELNIEARIADLAPEYAECGFDGGDLIFAGGHYLSAAELVRSFADSLRDGGRYDAAYKLSYSYDKQPLYSTRYPEMKLVWDDEFDCTGDLYDRRKWVQRPQMRAKDVVNGTGERNVVVRDGRRGRGSWSEDGDKRYSTNMSMTTYDSLNYCYGYLEMRAKVPFGKGCWPSFWMISKPEYSDQVYNTEIDIFEVFASPDSLWPNIHKWFHDGSGYHSQLGGDRKCPYVFGHTAGLSDEWHTYGFFWDETRMIFSVDGQDYCTFDITETGDFGDKPGMGGFHVPCYVILNNFIFTPLANWKPNGDASLVDERTVYPVTYTIDYIRLYQGENGILHKPSERAGYVPPVVVGE